MADLPVFRNVNYPYKDQHDTFIARGYHLNLLRDAIIESEAGTNLPTPLPWGQTANIVLGLSEDIDGCIINYKATFPDSSAIGAQYDEVGTVEINNSSEHVNKSALSWTRECTNHGQGFLDVVDIDILKVGDEIVLRLINGGSTDMLFTYTSKILKHGTN